MELGTLELAKAKIPAHQLFYFIQLSYFYLPKLKSTCTAVRADSASQAGVPQPFPSQNQLEEPVSATWAAQTCLASPRNCLFPGAVEQWPEPIPADVHRALCLPGARPLLGTQYIFWSTSGCLGFCYTRESLALQKHDVQDHGGFNSEGCRVICY